MTAINCKDTTVLLQLILQLDNSKVLWFYFSVFCMFGTEVEMFVLFKVNLVLKQLQVGAKYGYNTPTEKVLKTFSF